MVDGGHGGALGKVQNGDRLRIYEVDQLAAVLAVASLPVVEAHAVCTYVCVCVCMYVFRF